MIRRYLPQSTEELIHWYERYMSPFSLMVGFVVDAIAVQALNLTLYSYVLAGHLAFAASSIILLHAVETGRLRGKLILRIAPFIPVLIQFSFGALLSSFVILYSRSAAFSLSWIFVIMLAALLIGNERFRRFYSALPTQVGVLYFALFSFLILVVPILAGRVGHSIFLLSGLTSLCVIAAFLFVVRTLVPDITREVYQKCMRVVGAVLTTILVLYFAQAIPPLPLALRDAGVFHSVVRESGGYRVTYEEPRWYEGFRRYAKVFNRTPGEAAYVYTAVFAPTGISTGVVHEWEWYDDARDTWSARGRFEFPIAGGREGGYRGYSLKRDLEEGAWRVNVRTSYGQLIGRVAFEVRNVSSAPPLAEVVR